MRTSRKSHSIFQELLVVSLLSATIAGIVTAAGISFADQPGVGATGGSGSSAPAGAGGDGARSSSGGGESSIPSNMPQTCLSDLCETVTYIMGTSEQNRCSKKPDIAEICRVMGSGGSGGGSGTGSGGGSGGVSGGGSSAEAGRSSSQASSSAPASSISGFRCVNKECRIVSDPGQCASDQQATMSICFGGGSGGNSSAADSGNQGGESGFCLDAQCNQTRDRNACAPVEVQRRCVEGDGGRSDGGKTDDGEDGRSGQSGNGGEDRQGGGQQGVIRLEPVPSGGQQGTGQAGVTVVPQPVSPEFQARMEMRFHKDQEPEAVSVRQVASVAVTRLEGVLEQVKEDPAAAARIEAILQEVREAEQRTAQQQDDAREAESAREVQSLLTDAAQAVKQAQIERPDEAVLHSQRDAAAALLRNMWEDLVPVRELLTEYNVPVPDAVVHAQITVGRLLEQIPQTCRSALCPQILAGRDQMVAVAAALEGTVHTLYADNPDDQQRFMELLNSATMQNN